MEDTSPTWKCSDDKHLRIYKTCYLLLDILDTETNEKKERVADNKERDMAK